MPKSTSKAPPGRSPARRRSSTATRIDPRLVAFLYSDVGFPQRGIAKLLRTSQGAVERMVKAERLKPLQPVYGEWNREAVQWFPAVLPKDLAHPADVPADRLWVETRKALRRVVPVLFREGYGTALHPFLRHLPYILGAARARLTRQRLQLLYGELGLDMQDIAAMFDAPLPTVTSAIAEFGVLKGEPYLRLLDSGCRQLAAAVGVDDWDVDILLSDSTERAFRKHVLAARGGLRELAIAGKVDWSTVDAFIAMELERAKKLERHREAASSQRA